MSQVLIQITDLQLEKIVATATAKGVEVGAKNTVNLVSKIKTETSDHEATWVKPKTLAKILDISLASIYRMVNDDTLPKPSYHLGIKSPRFNLPEVNAMMKASTHQDSHSTTP